MSLIITVLLLAFISLYMADCIKFIYQCMESVQCFLVDENGTFYKQLFCEKADVFAFVVLLILLQMEMV